MARVADKRMRRKRAHLRLRKRLAGTGERPRLTVYKSRRYVYAQLIDDQTGTTLAQASSRERKIADKLEGGAQGKAAARAVGEEIAARAKERGLEMVVFDRGGYIYHGKVAELAEGARSGGLKF